WLNAPVFKALRNPTYSGDCKDCEFNDVCGGCRARAYAQTGDLMAQDPWCEYKPEGKQNKKPSSDKNGKPAWSREAEDRLSKAPFFLRGMVRKAVERYASSKGLKEITPEIMGELKRRKDRG
ncbi:MAG: hypothetical protein HY880_08475, partial [Deltaproteobacteria bacterium]|nr:hypothetical protein [Deltaproteobacteria bacterium]